MADFNGNIPGRHRMNGQIVGDLIFGVPGKSAYQLAVENGYEGSLEQWLEGLQGERGPQGPAGPAGDDYVLTDADKAEIAEMAAGLVEVPDSGGNAGQSGLSTTAANLLVNILRNGVYSTDQSDNITALAAELGVTEEEPDEPDIPVEPDIPDEPDEPEVTLTSISATYSGGDVTAGTAVSDLTGISVTAHYSDGTSEPVTGYTLSGTIAEGSNTVTVTYEGKTATFTVVGVAESADGEKTYLMDSLVWEQGYTLSGAGVVTQSDNWKTSQHIDITGYSTITFEDIADSGLLGCDIHFYNANQTHVSKVGGYFRKSNTNYPSPKTHTVPDGVVSARFCTNSDTTKFVIYAM